MQKEQRTYTLDQAAQELHISRETLERLLPNLGGGSQRSGDRLTEDELNQIIDLLNNNKNLASDLPRE